MFGLCTFCCDKLCIIWTQWEFYFCFQSGLQIQSYLILDILMLCIFLFLFFVKLEGHNNNIIKMRRIVGFDCWLCHFWEVTVYPVFRRSCRENVLCYVCYMSSDSWPYRFRESKILISAVVSQTYRRPTLRYL